MKELHDYMNYSEYVKYLRDHLNDLTHQVLEIQFRFTPVYEQKLRDISNMPESSSAKTRYRELLTKNLQPAFFKELERARNSIMEISGLLRNSDENTSDLSRLRERIDSVTGNIRKLSQACSAVENLEIVDEKAQEKKRQNADLAAGRLPDFASVFFRNCSSRDMLDKRYKALSKAFHPDTGIGDAAVFVILSQVYEKKKNEVD